MKNKLQLLLHPAFILSLTCLLLNDFYWKYEYHNWITGKISDFTGLFVLSVFLSAFFPKHTLFINVGIIIFFIWWKSPISQSTIDLINRSFSLSFQRVVDFSDYIALPIVFASYFLKPASYDLSLPRKLAVYFVSGVCLVAFCSTSYIRKFMISPDMGQRITYNEYYRSHSKMEDVLFKLDSMKISYKVDSFTTVPVNFYGGSLIIRDRDSGKANMMVIHPEQKDTAVYFRINERKPYIAIYDLKVNDEIIPQVNISLKTYVKTHELYLESIILSDEQFQDYSQKMSKTKKKFRKLVEEGLIKKIK